MNLLCTSLSQLYQDVPSSGRVHRFKGWKTSREQFPLDREVTLQVADNLGIKHPTDNKTNTPIVMTTDFFLTVREGYLIVYKTRTLKFEKGLNDRIIIRKFK
ncbi:hypothetical protein U2H26_15000 [Lysinibacillus irui]|nr:hypothetical protein [Lysinibacillus irui]